MSSTDPVSIQRLEYRESAWSIERTHLFFKLDAKSTRVRSELTLRCLQDADRGDALPPLRLDGVDVTLESVSLDGKALSATHYALDTQSLTLFNLPAYCVLTIDTCINPEANTALEGLYRSSGNFCTQCEAEGFRKITYYLDRPDVLSVFDVSIEADETQYPVMLSNGNLLEQESLGNGRHRVRWHDPHPKPCYLFALVAGQLSCIEDEFVTASGRVVLLQIYVQKHNIEHCDYAMLALKKSMLWDEQVYGFEYDLERFMIVAVDDFNMGAMENKGLNIFNSRFVLADTKTATDADFLGVEAVIAHEYFHNWTGNRITCRDWFQLSLKEGLTVFRDQCFSSDMHSATVKRIDDVRLLRARQFAEDASPMAHPIRPESYIEINNFYTLTVYEKGAEVIRMLHTLLGAQLWRQGIDEYVRRHDGSATTCEAFIDAMQSVTDADLAQFRLWYSTSGTPRLVINESYDAQAQIYSLMITQHIPDNAGQRDAPPLHIPLRMGLLDAKGGILSVSSDSSGIEQITEERSGSVMLNLTQRSQQFDFANIPSKPTASLLRGFSAPVKLEHALDDEQLAMLIIHDPDAFNRWEAVQRLAERVIMAQRHDTHANESLAALNKALARLLSDDQLEHAFKAEALKLPTIETLAESLDQVDYQQLGAAHHAIQLAVAMHLESQLRALVCTARDSGHAMLDDRSMGIRSLANTALGLLSYIPGYDWSDLARAQFVNADNMSDQLAALACLCHGTDAQRRTSLDEFEIMAIDHKLVLDKWFAVQASARRPQVIDDVSRLYQHRHFDIANPNRVRALVASFAMNNPLAFHAPDGQGYAFVAQRVIELDALNPQLAARLVTPLTRWSRLIESQQPLMRAQLARIRDSGKLSPDVFELVSKSLKSAN